MIMNNWMSFHIFLSGRDQTHSFLTEWLANSCDLMVKEQTIAQWFYIRYWDGGPHVRVRMQNCKISCAELQELFENNISQYIVDTPISKEVFYEEHNFDGVSVPKEQLKWYGEGSVLNLEYEPEYTRYGGKDAIGINESLFCISTSIAIRILRAIGTNHVKRTALSIQFMLITAIALHNSLDEIQLFFSHYAKSWEEYSPSIQKMASADSIHSDEFTRQQLLSLLSGVGPNFEKSTPLGYWFTSIKNAIEMFSKIYRNNLLINPISNKLVKLENEAHIAIANMVGSQIHMFNNRLGNSPEEEYYFSMKIVKTIKEIQS